MASSTWSDYYTCFVIRTNEWIMHSCQLFVKRLPDMCWCAPLLPAGTEASDPGGGGRLPVCGCCRDGSSDLRVGLCDTGAEPYPVWVVWQHSVWTGPPWWCGQAEGTAQYFRKLHDRYRMDVVPLTALCQLDMALLLWVLIIMGLSLCKHSYFIRVILWVTIMLDRIIVI